MFKRIIPGILFLMLNPFCMAQPDSLIARTIVSSAIKASFSGSLLYPGAGIGIEFPVLVTEMKKNPDTARSGPVTRDRLVSLNAVWYHHPGFHDNLFFAAGWIMRRNYGNGFFSEFSPAVGYSRTFLGGTTYEADNNGRVIIIKAAGYGYMAASIGAGAGYNFYGSAKIPVSLFLDINMLFMFPYNSTVYFRPVMQLGIIFKPHDFIPFSLRRRTLYK